jgi:hypothetical protein
VPSKKAPDRRGFVRMEDMSSVHRTSIQTVAVRMKSMQTAVVHMKSMQTKASARTAFVVDHKDLAASIGRSTSSRIVLHSLEFVAAASSAPDYRVERSAYHMMP